MIPKSPIFPMFPKFRQALVAGVLTLAHPAAAVIVTLSPSADSYIATNHQNHGTETFLRVRNNNNHRALVRFADADILSSVMGGVLNSATLELFIEDNNGLWGSGREVDVHALLEDWTESGVTFFCPDDTDTSNSTADCPVQWGGGNFNATATDSYLQTGSLTGTIQLDVTADVAAFLGGGDNFGWIVKKRNEGQNGLIDYTSREGTSAQRPELVLDVFIPPTATPTETPTATPTPTFTPTPTQTFTPSSTATPDPMCGTAPIVGCRQSIEGNKSLLVLKDKGGAKDKAIFKWIKGETTQIADFGDPLSSTNYTLCICDESSGTPALAMQALVPPGGICDGKPCWKTTRKGFKFKDKLTTNDGVKLINLKSGPAGKAKIIFKGQGLNLNLPALPLQQDQQVIVQLKNDINAGECWEARFSAPAKKNDSGIFKDRGEAPITFAPTVTPTPTDTVAPATSTPSQTSTAAGTATPTPTGPTPTPSSTDTPGASACGNGFLEPGEFYDDPANGIVGDPGGLECTIDAQVQSCTAAGSIEVAVSLVPPPATNATSATMLIGYKSDLAGLPAASGSSANANISWTTPLPFIRTSTDFDYAVRVITVRTDNPIDPGLPVFTIIFDTCSGQPAPDPETEFGCFVEGCSGLGGPIEDCACTTAAP